MTGWLAGPRAHLARGGPRARRLAGELSPAGAGTECAQSAALGRRSFAKSKGWLSARAGPHAK